LERRRTQADDEHVPEDHSHSRPDYASRHGTLRLPDILNLSLFIGADAGDGDPSVVKFYMVSLLAPISLIVCRSRRHFN